MIRQCMFGMALVAFGALGAFNERSAAALQSSTSSTEPTAGETRTPLGDGRWLIAGGQGPNGPLRTLAIADPSTNSVLVLPAQLDEERAWHTATVLSDGRVLIAGGNDVAGRPVAVIERFEPATETVTRVEIAGATARARHTATLLTDGRVLIVGGESNEANSVNELWDLESGSADGVQASTMRVGHSATLLADGRVLISGGTTVYGEPFTTNEVFDPRTSTFAPATGFETIDEGPYVVAESSPSNGASNVRLDARITIRLSRGGIVAESVTEQSVVLSDPNGPIARRVVAAEGGRLLFVWPLNPLVPDTKYVFGLQGVIDWMGVPLSANPLSFTTERDTKTADDAEDAESWIPDPAGNDGWRTNRAPSTWQLLPALHAEPGVTAVAGQVLTLDGRPLRDVTLEIDDESTRTDGTGRFVLRVNAAHSGRVELGIDGHTASRGAKAYGFFEYGLALHSGKTKVLPFTIWMPRLDTAHEVAIQSPTVGETVLTTPYIQGLELHLPPQTVITGEDGTTVRQIGITPIPIDRPPFPLATNVDVPVYFTVQPGSAYVRTLGPGPSGAWLVYPNYRHGVPGQQAQFFHYDPDEKGWYVYGVGTVTRDGTQVVPDATTRIYEFTGAMLDTGDSPAADGPPPGWKPCCEPVDPSTGLFVMNKTDLYLPDIIPLSLTRSYNSGDNLPRAFGRGMTHPYAMFLWSALQWQQADLILPEGGRVHYVRTSAGSSFSDAVFAHQETATTSASPTAFYKSVITWNGWGWNLTLTDGTVYVFGENAPLQAIRDRFGNTVTVDHSNGQTGTITKVTSPNGRWMSFTYGAGNRIATVTDNIGRTVSYGYDANGNMTSATDAEHGVTTYSWTSSNQLASITDARGLTFVTNTYQNGRIQSQALADPSQTFRFAYTLDAAGRIAQTDITDPRGHVERRMFNADHYTTSVTQALGLPETRTVTIDRQPGSNLVTAVTDAMQRRTAYTYDNAGHVLAVTQLAGTPDAVTTSYTYASRFALLTSITDPLGHVWSASYDLGGRLTALSDPLGNRTAISMSTAGLVTRVTDPLQHSWMFAYKGADLSAVTDPLNGVRRLFTDGGGRIVGASDPLGQTTGFSWNGLGEATAVTDPMGGRTAMTYDGNGNLVTVVDALGHTTRYTYDVFDRMAARTDPLQRSDSRQYDGNDNLTVVVDRKGQTTTYQYDALDRLSRIAFADGSSVAYTYDAGDRITEIADSTNGSILRSYDLFDRLLSETTPAGTVSYTYDAEGRRTSMTAGGQSPVQYAYDAAHHLMSIAQSGDSVALSYDAAGRRTSVSLPNGLAVFSVFDDSDRLVSRSYNLGSLIVGDLTYSYDMAGNLIATGGSWARTGLPQALSGAVYDEANRVTAWNGRGFTYDANGSLVSDGVNLFGWSARNLLSSVGGGASAMFQYDAMGRRRAKTVSGTTTSFVYDGLNVVQERVGGGVANILTGLGLDERFQRTDGVASAFLTDALGSTLGLADASGALITQHTYEPFGATTTTGAATLNASQFTSRENDGTGLYFYRARYYSPELGRFLSEDPLEFGGGDLNLYAYVGNRPTRSTDPFGLYNKDTHFDATDAIGRQVGMCTANAIQIAAGDQGIDDDIWTSPMPVENVKARELYHFTSPERLADLRRGAFDSGSLSAMGMYLHALQDSYSHQKGRKDRVGDRYGRWFGHAPKHSPDDPRARPELWRRMMRATSEELYAFNQIHPACLGPQ